ncbi:hypothetical protein SEPCBS119000_004007 [Sporothrix epigloea]|uniref:Exosome complex protein n=1 Tax=Sporothrix epigloea TaxID=1892477 RepID=A0ABP0DPQ9_9PEZI
MEDIQPRIRQLAADIDLLEAAVAPLFLHQPSAASTPATNGHAAAAMCLPLLDRAKLHVLASLALESTLYCSLNLAGVDARNHAVFRELQRVRQYMLKIDAAEKPPAAEEPAGSRLNKSAAIRFLKADLDDQPAMKAQLNELLKQEQAAAAAESAGATISTDATISKATPETLAASRASQNSSPRGRKRGGGATPAGGSAGSGSANGSLTKRPKHVGGRGTRTM